MSIVMDEYEWAEQMIESRDLGKKPLETLGRISKYYLANQYSKKDIKKMLETFLVQCDPSVCLPRWQDALDRIVKKSDKYPLIRVDGVHISWTEMQKIMALNGKQLQRLAFTLLCVAKYWDAVSPNNNHWVNTPDKELMELAAVKTTVRRQSSMFGELRDAGMLRFSRKVDNLNVQILFIDSDDPCLCIQDFRNLGFQYQKFCGEPCFECECCGAVVARASSHAGRPQKYCKSCANDMKIQQSVASVVRQRTIPLS